MKTRALLGSSAGVTVYATPRRLGVSIIDVLPVAPDQPFVEKLMPVAVGLDKDGKATPALAKKLAAKNLSHVDVGAIHGFGNRNRAEARSGQLGQATEELADRRSHRGENVDIAHENLALVGGTRALP